MAQATLEDVQRAADKLGFVVPEGHGEQYAELLSKTEQACLAILAEEDYKPKPNLAQWPRENVYLPQGADNPLRGWAWRADIGSGGPGSLLQGKSVVFKDTVCIAGVPLLFGTDAFVEYTPDVDATLVTRILESGGRITGKAACENFSHGATSASSPQGPVENPYAVGFTCGGSSSGCGALLGSGAADLGIGGDQGGSIRIPASFCGVVGLKPTFGLVPYTGVLSSEAATDHVGPMAANVLDTARLLEAIAGYDDMDDRQLGAPMPSDVPRYSQIVLDSRNANLQGKRIGVLKEAYDVAQLAPSVKAAFDATIERLQQLGADVQTISVPLQKLAPSMLHVLNKFGSGGTRLGRQVGRRGLYLNDYWAHLLPWDQEKYDKAKYFVSGTAMSSEYGWANHPTAYGRAMNLARRLRKEYDEALEGLDAIITPTVPQPARRHMPKDAGPVDYASANPGATAYTCAFNLTGHPALSIPMGFTPAMEADVVSEQDKQLRLPAGLQIVGKMWDEATVLVIGDALERQADWKTLYYE